jgi:hypothetical protein
MGVLPFINRWLEMGTIGLWVLLRRLFGFSVCGDVDSIIADYENVMPIYGRAILRPERSGTSFARHFFGIFETWRRHAVS